MAAPDTLTGPICNQEVGGSNPSPGTSDFNGLSPKILIVRPLARLCGLTADSFEERAFFPRLPEAKLPQIATNACILSDAAVPTVCLISGYLLKIRVPSVLVYHSTPSLSQALRGADVSSQSVRARKFERPSEGHLWKVAPAAR